MSSTSKGKTDPQLPEGGNDDALVFAIRAESTDDTPTIISKSHPTVEPLPIAAAEHITDLAAQGKGEALANHLRGKRLAHFELIEAIGVGGMAAVLRARDTQLDRQVALKILPPEMAADPENVRRFHQEAKAAARLDHENIARVFFCGEDQGLHFIAFEFVEGDNLRSLLERRGQLPVGEAVRYILQVATGLEHATARGVVHRDVKPSNIIVSPNGRAKLVDMGLARNMERQDADLTQSGVTLGTFDYISPEQALEPRDADARSDIYSLGCTFYHMLTGQPPVPEGTAAKKLHHHQHVAPVDPRQFNPSVPDEIAVILGRMMHKDPRSRYQRPIQLVQHLMQIARTVGAADDMPEGVLFVDAPLPTEPRNQTLMLVAVPFLALAVLIFALAMHPSDPPPVNTVQQPVAPNGDAGKSGTGTPTVVKPAVTPVSLPGEEKGIKDAKTLAAVFADKSFSSRRTIKLQGKIELGAAADLTLHAAPGQEITLTSADRTAPAHLQFDLDLESVVSTVGLVVKGGKSIVFDRLKIKVSSEQSWDDARAVIAVRGSTRVEFRDCIFEQHVPNMNMEKPGISSVLVEDEPADDGKPMITFTRCVFGDETSQPKPGQVAVAIRGPAAIRAVDCGFYPHAAFFHFHAGCDLDRTSVACKRCSGRVVNGPVFRFDRETGADLRVTESAFAPNDVNALFPPGPADLIHQLDQKPIRFRGEKNLYFSLNALWSAGQTFYVTYDQFKAALKPERGISADTDSSVPDRDTPSPWYGSSQQSAELAFQLKPEYADYGLKRGYWGELRPVLARESLAPNEKLFDPDYRGKDPAIYNNFDKAIANLENGDTLLIRPRKDGRPVELPPMALHAHVNFTLKPYPKTAPVLTLGKPAEKKDVAFFRLLDGVVKFEGLHFVLEPRQDGPGPQSIMLLGDDAQVAFERCVITMRGPRRASVIALVNPSELMTQPDQPRKMNSKVDFKNCFIRGDGDLAALSSCRPLPLTLDNALVALAGSLLAVEGTPQEVPPEQGPRMMLSNVSAFGQRPLFSLVCAAKNGKGLAQTTIEATSCLFAPILEKPPLIYVVAADVLSEEQFGKYVQWNNGTKNVFAKFNPMLDLGKPNEMGSVMPLDPQRWGKLFGEPQAGKMDFTVALPPDTPLWQATPEQLRPLEPEVTGGCGTLPELEPLLKALPAP